jgi:hypothetical protein
MDQSLDNAPGVMPPPELVQQWMDAPHGLGLGCHPARSVPDATYAKRLIEAAQWGANQELEACCKVLEDELSCFVSADLRAARRPKPLSLKEQALDAHNRMMAGEETQDDWAIVRRALEQLDD